MIRSILLYLWFKVNSFLAFFESIVIRNKSGTLSQFPPVFIIGPPRTGTTVLYQVLVDCYNFHYMNNLVRIFYGAPYIIGLLVWPWSRRRKKRDHESGYGRTKGLTGPSEVGNFWTRWFPKGKAYLRPQQNRNLSLLRKEIVSLSQRYKTSVLFKNTANSLRIITLNEVFPEALFIVCKRGPVDTAQSILKSRIDRYGDKNKWMGVKPKQIDTIKDHPYWQQVVEQIYYINQQIEEDSKVVGKDKFHYVSYEAFCNNVHEELESIEQFLTRHGCRKVAKAEAPKQFTCSRNRKVSEDDYEKIKQCVHDLWADRG